MNDSSSKIWVPSWAVDRIAFRIEKLNGRAVKMGVAPLKCEVIATEGRKVRMDSNELEEYSLIEVSGEPIRMPGGWTLEGSITWEDGLTIVDGRPGAKIPTSYRSASPGVCDHCHTDRRRASAVLFSNPDGRWVQVGRSCVKDYFQTNADAALWAAARFGEVGEIVDEEIGRGGRAIKTYPWEYAVALTIRIVERKGWLGSGKAAEIREAGGEAVSTIGRWLTYEQEIGEEATKFRDEIGKVDDADLEKARAVLAWAREHYLESSHSDYEHNLALLLTRDSIRDKRLGLGISIVAGWKREQEKTAERARKVNAHVGEIGQRRGFTGKLETVRSFETQFGTMFVARFDTPEGTLTYKGGTVWWNPDSGSDTVEFTATIKEHTAWNGWKETMVSRPALGLPAPKKAKKAKAAVAA